MGVFHFDHYYNCLPVYAGTVLLLSACAHVPVDYTRSVDPGGCVIEQITAAAFDEYQVQGVSRDGTLLAYAWRNGEDEDGKPLSGVYILNLVTGAKTALAAPMTNSGNFSPDGRHLVVAVSIGDDKTEIVEFDTGSGSTRIIAAHPGWDWLPSYSPDGQHIVFNTDRQDKQMDVYVYERASGALQRITDYDGYDAHAQFSPDGQRILFHRMQGRRDEGGYDFDLYVFDRATGIETRLTDSPYEESYAAFAPDGRHIVLSSDVHGKPEKHNLYVRAPDGESYVALTQGDWKDSYAYWTPDGRYIYFNSDRSGITNVFRIPMRSFDCERDEP